MRLNPDKGPVPAFTLDRKLHRSRRQMQRREWRLLVMLPLLLFILGALIQGAIKYAESIPVGSLEPEIQEIPLAPMPPLHLNEVAPLPDQAKIVAEEQDVAELLASQATVRHGDEVDATTLAWAEKLLAGDRTTPPIIQRVTARDLLQNGARQGSAVVLSGRLEDSVAAPVVGGRTWQRLAVAMDEGQFVQVLAPEDAGKIPIGREITVLGRYLGSAEVPAGNPAKTLTTPLVAARLVRESIPNQAPTDPEHGEEFRGQFPGLTKDVFSEVSDERTVLETRPYYQLLGQIATDRVIDPGPAANGNLRANDIHQDPTAHRAKRYTITGHVIRAWVDDGVARDRPYGLSRVVRVLMWNRDFGQVTEIQDGKTVFKSQILRLYELAALTDQPLPAKGEVLTCEGRFFKFRAIPVPEDRDRDRRNGVQRQSDRVYPFVFATTGWMPVPPPPRYEFGWATWIFSIGILAMAGTLAYFLRQDGQKHVKIRAQVTALRKTRRKLKLK